MDKYSDELAEFIESLESAKKEHEEARAAGKKKTAMKRLNYLFSPSVHNRVKRIATSGYCTGFKESDVARTAMYLGLKMLEDIKKEGEGSKLRGHMHIAKIRSKLGS